MVEKQLIDYDLDMVNKGLKSNKLAVHPCFPKYQNFKDTYLYVQLC